MQTDWIEVRDVDLGAEEGPETVYGFIITLSHSRKEVVVWSRGMKQLDWHHCHNEALKRLGGVAAVNRIDNLKTGVSRGAGPWGIVNPSYRTYAQTMGFHVDAHEVRRPEQKGKVERRAGVVQQRLPMKGRHFESLEDLQRWTDTRLEADAKRRICPITGLSVHETWEAEKARLRPLPATLPEPFDLVKDCAVYKDCTIRFEGRTYTVPFCYEGGRVEAHGCAGPVQSVALKSGEVVRTYPRHTQARLLIDRSCYEGDSTDRVAAPRPLGRMSRRLQEISALPVEQRPLDLYAALAEVAR
jgi:hypothetical protein